jgi:invasion protein IalB
MTPVRLILIAAALAAALPAAAQNAGRKGEKYLGKFGAWEAHRARAGGETVCYIAAVPERTNRKVAGRREVALMVSRWPKAKIDAQVKLAAGYTLKKDSTVTFRFVGRSYKLWTKGRNAWADGRKMDKAIVLAMEAGRKLTVESQPGKGKSVTDTFSLTGFNDAWDAARKACGK